MADTQIIPAADLTGLESALGDVDQLTTQLAPLRETAKTLEVKWPDRQAYAVVGSVLSEVRNLRKQGEARFQPFNLIVDRVRSFLKTNVQKHTNACEEVEALCRPKMKAFEQAELEAAKAEQAAINKKADKRGDAPVTVAPAIPSVAGYRRSTRYEVEVLDADKLLKQWVDASGKHKAYLRQFITINHQRLGEEARKLKDPDRLMKLVKGIRAFTAVLVASLLLGMSTPAKPWYRDWKNWAVIGAATASSLVATHQGSSCRQRAGVAPCSGGYGSFNGREYGVRLGTSVGLAALSVWGHQEGLPEWAVPAASVATFNAVVAVKQSRIMPKPCAGTSLVCD
jgi:hypothetical protein